MTFTFQAILNGTQLVFGECYHRYLHSGMKSKVTEPVIQGTFTYTHQSGSHSFQPLRARSWSLPQEEETKRQLPRGLFHAEVAYWLLCPREPAPCINALIDR